MDDKVTILKGFLQPSPSSKVTGPATSVEICLRMISDVILPLPNM